MLGEQALARIEGEIGELEGEKEMRVCDYGLHHWIKATFYNDEPFGVVVNLYDRLPELVPRYYTHSLLGCDLAMCADCISSVGLEQPPRVGLGAPCTECLVAPRPSVQILIDRKEERRERLQQWILPGEGGGKQRLRQVVQMLRVSGDVYQKMVRGEVGGRVGE